MDLSVNPQHFAFMFALFLMTLFVLGSFVFKPTVAILRERDHRLRGMLQEADFFLKQHDEKWDAYKGLLNDAKVLARQKREEILKIAEIEHRDIMLEAAQSAEQLIKQAKTEISILSKAAKLQLKKSAEELAQAMVGKLIKREAA